MKFCFVKGEHSNYIEVEEMEELKNFHTWTIDRNKDAGHWIHADQPMKLLGVIKTIFL